MYLDCSSSASTARFRPKPSAASLCVERLTPIPNTIFGDLATDSTPIKVSGYRNPLPLKLWPVMLLSKDTFSLILVNSFADLESEILRSISGNERNPHVYTVGPVLDLGENQDMVLRWLDSQTPESVVFLYFGSIGSFEREQVHQIAYGIERRDRRFLWLIRRHPIGAANGVRMPTDYEDFEEALPVGFLERNWSQHKYYFTILHYVC